MILSQLIQDRFLCDTTYLNFPLSTPNMNSQNQRQERKQSYESKMRVIGYLYNTLKDNYDEMQPEDFNSLRGEIGRLLHEAENLLTVPEESSSVFQTPPRNPPSLDPPILQRNQSHITMTRGSSNIVIESAVPLYDLSGNDQPMTLAELDDETVGIDDDENDDDYVFNDEEYQQYIRNKFRPKLTTKCHTIKEGRETVNECEICCEEYSFHNTVSLGCGHNLCRTCLSEHFHHSVENQPYKLYYACPFCRDNIKKVVVNYSSLNAKNRQSVMDTEIAKQLKTWCN